MRMGFTVKVLDIDKEEKPYYVQKVPTIVLLYKGKLIEHKTYWRAEDVLKFVTVYKPPRRL